ncbi:MAG TPA: hypothetical protein VKV05_08350 [Terriglobales bacterium]|nr:hypothetical protein [Terriglobales bacterium]
MNKKNDSKCISCSGAATKIMDYYNTEGGVRQEFLAAGDNTKESCAKFGYEGIQAAHTQEPGASEICENHAGL